MQYLGNNDRQPRSSTLGSLEVKEGMEELAEIRVVRLVIEEGMEELAEIQVVRLVIEVKRHNVVQGIAKLVAETLAYGYRVMFMCPRCT